MAWEYAGHILTVVCSIADSRLDCPSRGSNPRLVRDSCMALTSLAVATASATLRARPILYGTIWSRGGLPSRWLMDGTVDPPGGHARLAPMNLRRRT